MYSTGNEEGKNKKNEEVCLIFPLKTDVERHLISNLFLEFLTR